MYMTDSHIRCFLSSCRIFSKTKMTATEWPIILLHLCNHKLPQLCIFATHTLFRFYRINRKSLHEADHFPPSKKNSMSCTLVV
jgi:hypothetical protein